MGVFSTMAGSILSNAANTANNLQQVGQGLAISGANGLLGSLFAGWNMKRQRKQQEKLMAKQYEYAQKAFDAENKRQDWLMYNTPSIIRDSLKAAGYSPADPEGTGFAQGASNNNVEVPTAPSVSMPYFDPGLVSSYSAIASNRLASSNARLNEIEERYRAKQLEGQIGLLQQQIRQNEEKFPEIVANIKADTDSKLANKQVSEETAKRIVQETANLAEQLKGIQIDNRYKDELNAKQINVLVATASKLFAEGKVQAAYAALADKGIIAQGSGLAQVLSLLGSDDSAQVRDSVVSGANRLLGGLPGAAAKVISGIVNYAGENWRKFKYTNDQKSQAIKRMQQQGVPQRQINQFKITH